MTELRDAWVIDGVRTPFGRYGGALSSIRADDLAAASIHALLGRNPMLDPAQIDDVVFGCANQAGEDNRNVARMAALLAGMPPEVSGTTINRLCGSGMDAVAMAARTIRTGEAQFMIAGGVESMTRAPFVMGKPDAAFARSQKLEDTTLGWRFINPQMKSAYGVDTMAETAENVTAHYGISRADQDAFAHRSQLRAARAGAKGWLAEEIFPLAVPQPKGPPKVVSADEHPRPDTTLHGLAQLKPIVRADGTVTAGNAAGLNDGAAALLLGSAKEMSARSLNPMGRVVAAATAGVQPRMMGMGPVPAVQKLLGLTGLKLSQMDVIQLNEAFAAQAVAVLRELGVPEDADHVNPGGGAIALGHPLGASGARLVITALRHLMRTGGRYGLCTMCIGVGQGIALIVERT